MPTSTPEREVLKAKAAARALELIEPGMRVGLGTGSTARYFVEGLGRMVSRGVDVIGAYRDRAYRLSEVETRKISTWVVVFGEYKPRPDWIIRLVAMFGGPARQIINDIGNEKVFDGRKGEALIGHPYFSARQSIKDTAESVLRLGLKFRLAKD